MTSRAASPDLTIGIITGLAGGVAGLTLAFLIFWLLPKYEMEDARIRQLEKQMDVALPVTKDHEDRLRAIERAPVQQSQPSEAPK